MVVRSRQSGTEIRRQPQSFAEWTAAARVSFSERDLVAVLDAMTRSTAAADLSANDRSFWNENSGVAVSEAAVASASVANAAAQVALDSSAISAAEVAKRMHLSASTVRHYKAARRLYSNMVNGKLVFPVWQFNDAGDTPIPALNDILAVLPDDLHPQSVAGFFLTLQPDLVLDGEPVSAKAWLEAGGSKDVVVGLAESLALGY